MQHHAYIYEGALSLLEALADDARTRFGFPPEHSPDVHVREFEKFGIEESRWLSDVGALKSSSSRALFVVGISSVTSEAQQALLKLFEEPQEGSVYVALVPHGTILPTLRSRMLEYPERQIGPKKVLGSAVQFLKSSGKDRSDFITKLLKDDDGQKERVREFLNALEAELYKGIGKNAKARAGLEDIAKVRDYVRDRSPSLKMLLEHLAVSLPTV
ncbi:MAG: polymerase subunit delta, polymerase subunit delta protein [Candidatus Adlerbacteria bacterium]|nr:polymerase subunit delta, polymerase subunit delta protein [Candidatus Adlerbacteria bacterium]